MKYLFTFFCIMAVYAANAQPIRRFNYQGIARNATGAPITNQALGLRLTIHDATPAGTIVYQETQNPQTNAYGLYNTAIGNGIVITGSMNTIKWKTDKYLQVEIDPAGGNNYVDAGTTQLLSVPYSLYADKFHIPYTDTATDTGSLFTIQNNGSGRAIKGINSSPADSAYAIYGVLSDTASRYTAAAIQGRSSGKGMAIQGINTSTADSVYAIRGVLSDTNSRSTAAAIQGISNGKASAIEGINRNTSISDSVYGVKGVINSIPRRLGSAGVYGAINCNNHGLNHGSSNAGVYGSSNGSATGVLGISEMGTGVLGVARKYNTSLPSYGHGVEGISFNELSNGVRAENTSTGVGLYASSILGIAAHFSISNPVSGAEALYLTSLTSRTMYARGQGSTVIQATQLLAPSTVVTGYKCIYGESSTGIGVAGASSANNAVYGIATATSYAGVAGSSSSATGYGVWGTNTAGGLAGYFQGDVTITGNLSKGSGTFKIDHPGDPENKYLYHSFVESPDMMNIYNGNITTNDKGDATIDLPGYFAQLNKDFCYQLTVIGTFAQAIVSEEISGNTFSIKTDKPNIRVSWQVTGVRSDPYANAHRVQAEVEKEPGNKGKYLHPVEYKQPEAKGIGYQRP